MPILTKNNAQRLQGEPIPGVPFPIDLAKFIGSTKLDSFMLSTPFREDMEKNNMLVIDFLTKGPDGDQFWRIYGLSVDQIKEGVENFKTVYKLKYSPQGKLVRNLNSEDKNLKNKIEEVEIKAKNLTHVLKTTRPEDQAAVSKSIAALNAEKTALIAGLNAIERAKADPNIRSEEANVYSN